MPFWHAIYEAGMDPRPRTIVVVTASQMAKTEAMLNIVGHRATDGPFMPSLYVGPTEKQVRSMSRGRFDAMLRSTPILWERLEKGQKNTVYEKYIAGVRLGFGWAGSATELASHPVGVVLVDERDRMEGDVQGEGDPVTLAGARTKNYPLGKVFVFSTPTVEGASPIWSLFESGTMQKWAWACAHCGNWFVPRLELLRWPQDADEGTAEREARVVCPHCGAELEERHKLAMNAGGRYIPHGKAADGSHVALEAPIDSPTWSYWASGLASPWASFGRIAATLVQAYRSHDQEKIQGVINTWGGEVFKVKGEAPEWAEVAGLRREYVAGQVPAGVQLITMGADVQKYGVYWIVRGWGFGLESWLLAHGYIEGLTEFDTPFVSLSATLQRPYGDRYINRGLVDSGYRPGDTEKRPDHAVYSWARRHPGVGFPSKGWDQADQPIKFTPIDVQASDGKLVRHGVNLAHVNTDYFKRWIHSRVKWPEGQPGGWHLHAGTTEDYCKQIVSEQLVIKSSGRGTWIRKGPNHYLDCEVLATAAAWSLNAFSLAPLPEEPPPSAPSGVDSARRTDSPYSRREL